MKTPKRLRTASVSSLTPKSASKYVTKFLSVSALDTMRRKIGEVVDALVGACMLGELDVVNKILEDNADRADFRQIINGYSTKYSSTPLLAALKVNNEEIVEKLLFYDASLTYKDEHVHDSPIEFAWDPRRNVSTPIKTSVLKKVSNLEKRNPSKRKQSSPLSTPV